MGSSRTSLVFGARSRALRRCAGLALVAVTSWVLVSETVFVASARPAAAADADPGWHRPVEGGVRRAFAEPAGPYGAGHRGVDLAAAPGTVVRAAGAGTVTFAGDVAGALHVVVTHRNGLRTSYSFLADATVSVGDVVTTATVVGHAGGTDTDSNHSPGVVHFGLRVRERYVDPMLLFDARDLRDLVRLVPVEGVPAESWAHARLDEAATLPVGWRPHGEVDTPTGTDGDGCSSGVPIVGGAIDAVCDGVDWTARRTRDAFDAGLGLLATANARGRALVAGLRAPLLEMLDQMGSVEARVRSQLLSTPAGEVLRDLVEIGDRFLDWTRAECSGEAPRADGTGGSGHLVMAVGGIDSSSSGADRRSFGLDAEALGYHRDEVHWFSYAADGGAYSKGDTHGDLVTAAARMAEQLRALDMREPGREIDLIAHSQGGVVVDVFLRMYYDASDPTFPPLGTVVTLASPHQGAPLATTGAHLRRNRTTRRALDVIDAVAPGPPSDATSVAQLAETSSLMRNLWADGLPDHIHFTTIGGTDDSVVPANRIRVPGATEVVVAVAGVNDHTAITSDDRSLQVVRAALENRPVPCTSVMEGLRSAIEPVLVTRVESDLGPALTTYLAVR